MALIWIWAIIALGIVLPFALWCLHEHRRRERERIEQAVAEWYGDAELSKPTLVMWADPRRFDYPGQAPGRRYRVPASPRPD